MADVNELFCDKHTFLPCIESEVGFHVKNSEIISIVLDTSSNETGANINSYWTCE